jgi:UDP-N-acetylmuramate--alanine ligase
MKNLKTAQNIHCIGVGGTGVSGLARLLMHMGKKVSGSDEKESQTIICLEDEGAKVFIGHSAENVGNADVVVYSQAVAETNPERIWAKEHNIPQLTYSQAVGELTSEKKTICISGTHGKTTTTGLLTAAFLSAKQDTTVIVGSNIRELDNKNERYGKGDTMILESCEYKRSFLDYEPHVAIITNLEADHLDYYKDIEDYKSAFREFLEKVPGNGLVVINGDDSNIVPILSGLNSRIVRFGQNPDNDYVINGNILYQKGVQIAEFNLQIPGIHNIYNATAAYVVCKELGIDTTLALQGLNAYQGAGRRLEHITKIGDTEFYDDYGHHPTEVKATLKALREKYGKDAKILCIFQPHQYSRTYKLLEGFSTAFQDANEVIIPNILRARDSEEDMKKVNVTKLVEAIQKNNSSVSDGKDFETTANLIKQKMASYDVIITMGAGDVWKLHKMINQK